MRRTLATGLLAAAAVVVTAAAPAMADAQAPVADPGTGSASVIQCDDGPRVWFLGTGSAAIDLGASALGLLYGGSTGTGSTDNSSQVPCNTTRHGLDALLTALYRTGSAG